MHTMTFRKPLEPSSSGLNYNSDHLNIQLSPYYIVNKNIFSINSSKKEAELYSVEILGVDVAAIASIPVPQIKQLKLWTYLTWYPLTLRTSEDNQCNQSYGAYISDGIMGHNLNDRNCWIGDIANLQVKGGVTVKPINQVVVTALARYVNKRITVRSNPVEKIEPYVSLDDRHATQSDISGAKLESVGDKHFRHGIFSPRNRSSQLRQQDHHHAIFELPQ